MVYTDHVSLKFLQSLKLSAHNRLARWALALQPYNFTVEHVAGKKLTAADGLSRRPYEEPDNLEDDEELQEDSFIVQINPDVFDSVTDNALAVDKIKRQWHVLSLTSDAESQNQPSDSSSPETMRSDEVEQASTSPTAMIDLWAAQERDIQQLQHESKDLQPILDWLEHGILPQTDKEARQLILRSEHFQIIDGVLYHLHFPRTKRLNVIKPILHQLCVPDVLREELLIAYHDNNAHIGRERLYDTLKQKYYFPQMYTSVIEYVAACDNCQRKKSSPHLRKAPLAPLPIVEPFGRVHIDHVGPLPKTPEGFRHLLVVVDSTTLWAEAFPCRSTTAEETALILYREIICRYGAMKAIETDGGTAFRNKLMTELCKLLKIKHIISSPRHAMANSKVERTNRSLMSSLKSVCEKQEDWAQNIAPVLFAFRATVSIPLGISPFQALFGRQMTVGFDLSLLKEFESAPNIQAYAADLASKVRLTHDIIQKNMTDRAVRSKEFYDKNTRVPQIAVGAKVLLFNDALKPGESPKFHDNWTGPYLVVSKSDNGLLYRLRHCDSGKEPRAAIHANRLKVYDDDKDRFFIRHNIKPQQKNDSVSAEPAPADDSVPNDEWFPIDKLLSHKNKGNKVFYRVKWLDSNSIPSWESEDNITPFAIEQYFIQRRKKSNQRRKRRG